MTDFFSLDIYDEKSIDSLIANSAEESINLDFKAAGSLDNNTSKKNEISKDASAFANSDGGIIVYGVSESAHKATAVSFIDGDQFTKEWLEQIINSQIQKRIQGLKIYPVRFSGDIKKTVYVVKIPQSNDAPHIAAGNRFYKRYNFQSIPMEEYEVRMLYDRKLKTELEIDELILNEPLLSEMHGTIKEELYCVYILGFQIRNIGNSIEKDYKLEIEIPSIVIDREYEDNPIQKYFVRHIYYTDSNVYSIPNKSPLFQAELTTMLLAYIRVSIKTISSFISPGIRMRLYYSNGIKEKTLNISDKFLYNGQLLINIFK